MTLREFQLYMEAKKDTKEKKENIFPESLPAQEALGILKDHFLGENWYSVNPISTEQINAEIVAEILSSYPNTYEVFIEKLINFIDKIKIKLNKKKKKNKSWRGINKSLKK